MRLHYNVCREGEPGKGNNADIASYNYIVGLFEDPMSRAYCISL